MDDRTMRPECAQTLATQGTRIENLEQWQRRQNGSLQRMEASVERLHDKLDTALARVYDRIDATRDAGDRKSTNAKVAVISIMASGAITLLALILTHALGGRV